MEFSPNNDEEETSNVNTGNWPMNVADKNNHDTSNQLTADADKNDTELEKGPMVGTVIVGKTN